jgi:hypothetical protein
MKSFHGFGNPKEWEYFETTYPEFIRAYDRLQGTFARAFSRIINEGQPDADRVIFNLGFLCCAQFNELSLLCANGYGIAAQRILRSIYESGVVIDYLAAFPEEAADFLDWGDVHLYKDLKESNAEKDPELAEEWKYVETNFLRVKDRFQTTNCKKCGTKKPMISWSKKDVRSQARAAGSVLEGYYHQAYFEPTLQIHSTIPSILARMKIDPETDQLYISTDSQRDRAKMTLSTAHFVILTILFTQEKYFQLGLESELFERGKDLEECWIKEEVE